MAAGGAALWNERAGSAGSAAGGTLAEVGGGGWCLWGGAQGGGTRRNPQPQTTTVRGWIAAKARVPDTPMGEEAKRQRRGFWKFPLVVIG